MINPQNVAFLRAIAEGADPLFRQLLSGIADFYQSCGTLSPKQLASVQVSANKQRRKIPESLLAAGQPPEEPPAAPAPAPDTNAVLADLFGEIANALTRAATRLSGPHF